MKRSLGTSDAPAPGSPRAGEVLGGRYKLVEELARGGMGRVFAALDTELGRKVAIKLIASPSPDATALQRFRQEARALAALNHPNILDIHDIHEADDYGGHPYLVCELLEGVTLREKAVGSLPLREVLEIAVQIAAGLAVAHERRIVHRDLKPDNVFITAEGRVKLLDFGIAKLALAPLAETISQDASAESARADDPRTAEGRVMGTAGYMAPEQVRGGPIDHRADLFGFGALLYELLTSRRAFPGATTAETGDAILHSQPPPIDRGVPSAIRRIVERCLEKDPEQRFQSAEELLRELEAARATLIGRPSRARWRWAAASVALLVLAVALIATRRPARRDRTVLLVPLQAEPADAPLAASIDLALQRAFADVPVVVLSQPLHATAVAGDHAGGWVLRGSLSRAGPRLRLSAQFETAAGQRLGEAIEAAGSAEQLEKDASELGDRARDQFLPLWRDRLRRERAHQLAGNRDAEEKLVAYYDLMGASPRPEFLDRGRRLLDDALAADARYVPALAERSLLWRLASSRAGDDPAADLRLSRADADAALRIAPHDPQSLLAQCLAVRLQMRDWPSDRELAAATSACSDATQADPQSVDALYSLALLYDQGCEERPLVESLKLALERARRYDRRSLGQVMFYLVSVALQREHLQEADGSSAELLAAASAPPQGAHLLRAAVLLRLHRHDEAQREIETELAQGAAAVGGLDETIEAASLRGLARTLALQGRALDGGRAARLTALESRFAAKDEHTANLSAIAGWYGFVDPEAAVAWLERHKPQGGCNLAFQRAVIYGDAGHPDRAARALAACTPTEDWARRCERVISSRLTGGP